MAGNSSLHQGHRARMRKRFAAGGMNFNTFENHEVLEMILFSCYRQRNTNEIAHELINKFGSLEGVVNAPLEELCEVKYVSESVAAHLKFYGELMRLIERSEECRRPDLENSIELARWLKSVFANAAEESMYIVCGYEGNKPLKYYRSASADVYDSDALRLLIISAQPEEFVTVHFTPCPNDAPVAHELELSGEIRTFAAVNEIGYADHCIFDGEDLRSFKDEGLF